jgi:hypothetical protein
MAPARRPYGYRCRRNVIDSLVPSPQSPDRKDTVVLADFVNTTGDPVFDETLRQWMAVQLEQSPF